MIKIDFRLVTDSKCILKVTGHSGYAARGHDIVCAAISVLTHLFAVGITTHFNAELRGDLDEAVCDVTMSVDASKAEVFKSLYEMFLDEFQIIQGAYPKHIDLITE